MNRNERWNVSRLFYWTVVAVGAGLIIAAAASLTIAFLAFGWAPWNIRSATRSGEPNFIEAVKVGLTVAAGIGGAVALVVAFRRQQILERDEEGQRARTSVRLAEEAAQRERERDRLRGIQEQHDADRALEVHRLERYGAAAQQLGASAPTVRLAGVYSLANLADEWPERRQQCVDLLCAYLRLPPTGWEPIDAPESALAFLRASGEFEVRAVILAITVARLRPDARTSWSDLKFDLRHAHLPGVDFDGCQFDRSLEMTGAHVYGDLTFSDGRLGGGVDLANAVVSGWVHGDRLRCGDANFAGLETSGGLVMREAQMENLVLDGARIAQDVSFSGSNINGLTHGSGAVIGGIASLDGVTFRSDVVFSKTTFRGEANFTTCHFKGGVTFGGTKFCSDANFSSSAFTGYSLGRHGAVSGALVFSACSFQGSADFSECKSYGPAVFSDAAFAEAPKLGYAIRLKVVGYRG